MLQSLSRTVLLTLVLLLLTAAAIFSQDTPTLTPVEKLTLQVKYLGYENARLKLDAAQADLVAYIKSLEKAGYTLDVNTGVYTPLPESK